MNSDELTPDEIVRLLLATADDPKSGDRNDVVLRVRRHLQKVARHQFPRLDDEIEDVVQVAIQEVCRVDLLLKLPVASQFWQWARGTLVRRALDAIRARGRRAGRLAHAPVQEDAPEPQDDWLDRLIVSWKDSPEAHAERYEMLRKALPIIAQDEVAWMRIVLDLSEEEVCSRMGLTRDQVAQRVKRIRAKIRKLLDPEDE